LDASLGEDGLLQVTDEGIVGLAEGQVSLDALPDDGVVEGFGDGGALALM
jgi:hypothetical protein